MWLIALALFAQTVGPPDIDTVGAYFTHPTGVWELQLPDGRYDLLRLDGGCVFLDPSQNLQVSYGSGDGEGNVGILLWQNGQSCSGLLGDQVDATPCTTDPRGDCDIASGAQP